MQKFSIREHKLDIIGIILGTVFFILSYIPENIMENAYLIFTILHILVILVVFHKHYIIIVKKNKVPKGNIFMQVFLMYLIFGILIYVHIYKLK